MRRLFIIILALCIQQMSWADTRRESHIGSDPVAALCFGQLRIYAGHAIGNKWSIDTGVYLNMKRLASERSDMEKEHWNSLYGYEIKSKKMRDNLFVGNMSFCFWPQAPYKGVVFSIGGSIADRTHPDITVGTGYFCTVWKGLRAGLEYRLHVNECLENRQIPIEGFKASIGYAF